MPWTPSQATKHTHKANTPRKKRMWRDVADSALKRGQSERAAIRQANAVVSRAKRKSKRSKRR